MRKKEKKISWSQREEAEQESKKQREQGFKTLVHQGKKTMTLAWLFSSFCLQKPNQIFLLFCLKSEETTLGALEANPRDYSAKARARQRKAKKKIRS